jgi:hypothetical protein
MREREQKPFGLLFPNDVFLYDGVAYQKQEDGTAIAPSLQESRSFLLTTVVEFFGYGIWPSGSHGDIATVES